MIPRGRLDIPWAHLAVATGICAGWRPQAPALPGIAGSSVRALWGCTLDALRLRAGSRVGISSPTVPGMVNRITERGLVPVPLPINQSLTLPLTTLPEGLSAVLVAHLFGVRIDLEPLSQWCRTRNLPLIEDCAQMWDGKADPQDADVRLTSFGMIKRCTALGGAMAVAKDANVHAAIADCVTRLPCAPASRLRWRVARAMLIQILATRPGTSTLHAVAAAAGQDPDDAVRCLIRAYSPDQEAHAARLGLHPAERALLAWRLAWARPECQPYQVRWREIPPAARVGHHQGIPSWLLPLQVADPHAVVTGLRHRGFDASSRASGIIDLAQVDRGGLCAARLVYLPTRGPLITQSLLAEAGCRPTPSRP
jgi:perosamine synthetase